VSTPVEKFITSIAPRKEKPLTVAVGTAAYQIASAAGNTILEVGPERCTLPKPVSLAVSIAKTVLLLASKAAKMFRVGEVAISPGEVPALSGETRARVSFKPSINTRPPKVKVEVTPWEARTRFFRGELYPLQETRFSPAQNRATRTRMRFFKRQAPNDMKKGDLIAKWWIITDPALRLMKVNLPVI